MNAEMFGTDAAAFYEEGIFDPELLPEGPNIYGYVGNNPVNYVDPTGQWLIPAGRAAFAFLNKCGAKAWNKGKEVWKNTNIDGPLGTRVCQLRWKKEPVFRLDHGPVPGQTGPKWHYHRPPNMKQHRPYEGGW